VKPPVLLCYNLVGEKSRKIRLLAMRLTIRVRVVVPEEYGQTLVALCGMEPLKPAATPEAVFTDEMLVLAHFSTDLLDRFLSAFRRDGIEPVALKAMLTETNQSWDSHTLHDQLAEEHQALAKGAPPAHSSTQERS